MLTIKFLNSIILILSLLFEGKIDFITKKIASDPFLLAEGRGGAGFILGEDKLNIIKKLGKPSKFMPAEEVFKNTNPPFEADEILMYKKPKRIFAFKDSKLVAIFVSNDASWHTLLNVKIGTLKNKVVETYGYNYIQQQEDLIYKTIGIAFLIENNKVKGMAIFEPRD